jgi:hypothetical protein
MLLWGNPEIVRTGGVFFIVPLMQKQANPSAREPKGFAKGSHRALR